MPTMRNLLVEVDVLGPIYTRNLDFSRPSTHVDAQVILYDQNQNPGMQMQTVEVDELTNSASLNTSALANGIYIVYLQVNGVGVASDQLVVIH